MTHTKQPLRDLLSLAACVALAMRDEYPQHADGHENGHAGFCDDISEAVSAWYDDAVKTHSVTLAADNAIGILEAAWRAESGVPLYEVADRIAAALAARYNTLSEGR